MFKILTYAYSQNIYSSRKIESACKRDINFMWLLAGQKAPDHSRLLVFAPDFWQMPVKLRNLCKQIYICLEEIHWEMGRKNAP